MTLNAQAECTACGREWIARCPDGLDVYFIECPDCRKMTGEVFMGEGLEGYKLSNLHVGLLVHYMARYKDGGAECIAAIVTRVHDWQYPGVVDLTTFRHSGNYVESFQKVSGNQEDKPHNTWHWPERP